MSGDNSSWFRRSLGDTTLPIEWYLDGGANARDLAVFAELPKGEWPDTITIYHPIARGQIGRALPDRWRHSADGSEEEIKLPEPNDDEGTIVLQRMHRKPMLDITFGEEQDGECYSFCGENMQINLHVYEDRE